MKASLFSLLLLITAALSASPLALSTVKSDISLFEALQKRQTRREFRNQPLDSALLKQLLWAGNGVNRPESGKRTSPAALGRHAITLYVMNADGIWKYDERTGALALSSSSNLLAAAEGRGTMAVASGNAILLVADYSVFKDFPQEAALSMVGVEAGAVCQNIYLACAALNLNAVCCGSLNQDAIRQALALPQPQVPLLTMVVGYPPEK